jgi:hypothetical protein
MQVAQDRVEHRQRVSVLPDHAQVQRSLAGRAAAPDRLEQHVVKPVEQEEEHIHRADREAVDPGRDIDQVHQQRDREQQADPDGQVDQVGQRSAGWTGELVVEADVLGRLDLRGRVDRHDVGLSHRVNRRAHVEPGWLIAGGGVNHRAATARAARCAARERVVRPRRRGLGRRGQA